jgi:hypothetical protein
VDEVSPELALVDPELAAAARQALATPTLDSSARRPSTATNVRHRRRGGSLVAAAVLGAGVVVLLGGRQDERPETATAAAASARVLGAQTLQRQPPKSLPASGRAARVFAWHETKGAVSYYVTFARNARPFYAAQTRDPWLRIPDNVGFPPGMYSWSVRPAVADESGIVLRDAIVVRTFRVTRG